MVLLLLPGRQATSVKRHLCKPPWPASWQHLESFQVSAGEGAVPRKRLLKFYIDILKAMPHEKHSIEGSQIVWETLHRLITPRCKLQGYGESALICRDASCMKCWEELSCCLRGSAFLNCCLIVTCLPCSIHRAVPGSQPCHPQPP